MVDVQQEKLREWVERLLSKGKYIFQLEAVQEALPHYSETAVKRALSRLSEQDKILSVHKGVYLIIPPRYRAKGILPPPLFLDDLMHCLNRPYYLGLLNAAAYHGAAHQQPQTFFVFTNFPTLRPTQKKGIKIEFISRKTILPGLLEQRKTEAGYLTISNPALTAADLIHFEKRIGSLSRAATVLSELAEALQPESWTSELLQHKPVSVLQRLGYILDKVLKEKELALALLEACRRSGIHFSPAKLKTSSGKKDAALDPVWGIIPNIHLSLDE
jgi:predicted transcriptional regulator of viral defense system